MEPIQMFRSTDGKLFPTERDCARYEMDKEFLSKLEELASMAFSMGAGSPSPIRDAKTAREELVKWVVRKQEFLCAILVEYAKNISEFNAMYPAKGSSNETKLA